MRNIVISDSGKLENIKQEIVKQGKEKVHVIADFDRTLTRAFVRGRRVTSLISVLRDYNYLTEEYTKRANALRDKYYSIELADIPLREKKKAMHEWWTEHFRLLVESKLNKKDLEMVVKSEKVKLRKGALSFFDFLYKQKIPLVILSSAGLGGDSIAMFLENEKRLYGNIHIISNSFKWDKNGYAVGVEKPIIHRMNKDEIPVKDFPVYKIIRNRKNVILLGDSLSDIEMVKGFDYEKIIKIGFLNESIRENLKSYKEDYDVVILNDGSMDYVNKLMREIIK